MKKIISISVIIILVVLCSFYYISNSVKNNISDFVSNNENFSTSKNEIRSGLFNTSGVLEGVISKAQAKNYIRKYLNTALFSISANDRAEILENFDEDQDIVPYDISFRYTYDIKHSPLGLAGGFESNGKIKILTPEYAVILKQLFGTDEFLNVNIIKNLSDTKTALKFENANFEGFSTKNLEILSTNDNDGKIKDVAIKLGNFSLIDQIKIIIDDINTNISYDKAVDFSDIKSLIDVNYNSELKIKSAEISGIGGSVKLADITDNAHSDNGGDMMVAKENLKIGEISIFNNMLKNANLAVSVKADKNLVGKFIEASEHVDFLDDKNALNKIFNAFGKGLEMNIDNFSVENSANNSLNFNLMMSLKDLKDIDVNNEEDFINKIAPNFALKGEFNAIPDIKTFLSPYLTDTELSTLNDIENSEFFVRNSDKLSLKFAYDPQKIDILINDKISLKQYGGILGIFATRDDAEIQRTATNLMTLLGDVSAYYTSQARFANNLSYMTNVPLVDEKYLITNNKKCLEIEISGLDIIVKKSLDQYDRICQKLYQDYAVANSLEQGKFSVFK
ncbi:MULTISPECIES: hypothetical protein [Campylobacter]|uniref:hypothetical protein n=1 Tax=Campylobacter TaxID=194 RepID=UPI0023F185C4|nr:MULTISPECIES: hypothetical protein [Campylobacter]MCI6641351.1 hypothetical protein [Campylobacter sp.]MDD7423297.1 hypothetical protein [Campylobacter hominis]MDY3117725.1 hypothetical protein [Campylobacter hominis]